MDNDYAFRPQGDLVSLVAAVAASAPAPVQIYTVPASASSSGTLPAPCIEVINDGSATAFLCYGNTSALAAAVAAAGIPSGTGTQSGMIPIPAGSDKVYSLSSDLYYSAICAASTVQLWVKAGNGV